jgi:subtilase family serine protease
MIKLFLGAVAVAGLIAACGGRGPAADGGYAARSAKTGPPPGCLVPPATCYTPRVFRTAYGISPLLERGIDGRGQTVVIPEIAQPPGPDATDIRQDMARFDSLFGLPPARLRVVNSLAGAGSPWLAGGEEVEDAEMVHAVAPGATISIVLVKRSAVNSPADFAAALTAFLRLAATHGGVLSISASIGEHYLTPAEVAGVDAALRADRDHHLTVVAASGDKGAASDLHFGSTTPVKEVSLPASDPLVLAAGGTSLTADRATGAYTGETAWNTLPAPPSPGDGSSASGGGFSHLFARPGYQDGVPGAGTTRGVPDVAGDAASTPAWPSSPAAPPARPSCARPPAPAPQPPSGLAWSRWPTSSRTGTSASSTPPSTASPAARSTTRRSTTSPPATTHSPSRPPRSPAIRRAPAGTR